MKCEFIFDREFYETSYIYAWKWFIYWIHWRFHLHRPSRNMHSYCI